MSEDPLSSNPEKPPQNLTSLLQAGQSTSQAKTKNILLTIAFVFFNATLYFLLLSLQCKGGFFLTDADKIENGIFDHGALSNQMKNIIQENIKEEIKKELDNQISDFIKEEVEEEIGERERKEDQASEIQIKRQTKFATLRENQRKIYSRKYPYFRWDDQEIVSKVNFAITLLFNKGKQEIQKAEYYRLNSLYKIDEFKEELPLCVSICGRSSLKTYNEMLRTVFAQKYSNYKVVFVDDGKDSRIMQKTKNYIQKNSKKVKVIDIYNKKRQYSLKNRDTSIRNYCEEDDIVVDVDLDDTLVGVYTFQLINTLYQRYPENWALYFACIADIQNGGIKIFSASIGKIPDEVFQAGNYRTSGVWKTSELRTFRRKLFMKIDTKDFIDPYGHYYKEKADGFIHTALVQLAGKDHVMKIDEPLYYYRYNDSPREYHNPEKKIAFLAIHMTIPYLPLSSLQDHPQRKKNYKVLKQDLLGLVKARKTIDRDRRIKIPEHQYIPNDFDSTLLNAHPQKKIQRKKEKIIQTFDLKDKNEENPMIDQLP